MSLIYRNLPAEHTYAYPAANRSDGGEDNSEKNLRTLTGKFAIKSFVVRRSPDPDPEYFSISFSTDDNGSQCMHLARGECSIAGYYLRLGQVEDNNLVGEVIVKDINSLDLKPNRTVNGPEGPYYVTIACLLDATDLLSGDGISVKGPDVNTVVSRGVRVQFMTKEEVEDPDVVRRTPYLILGTIETDSQGIFVEDSFIWHENRYSFIDSSTILTHSGQMIEDWVNERIFYEIAHLSQLNYFDSEKDESSSATWKIVPVVRDGVVISYDVVFVRSTQDDLVEEYPEEVSFSEVEKRTRPADPSKYESPGGLKLDGSEGSTYNGASPDIARADHLHDNRYVHKLESDRQQEVKSPIKFNKKVTTGGGISGTGFDINDDGSASLGGKNLNIDKNGNVTSVGNVTSTGDITAKRVFNAVWNDYAELYRKDDPRQIIEPGTVIAKIPGRDAYAPVTEHSRNLVVGVCSDTYGHLLGGDQVDANENLRNFIPVALAGRVHVKVVKGAVVSEGDLMVASAVQGRATTCTQRREQYGVIIGKALESSDGTKDKVLIQVFLG